MDTTFEIVSISADDMADFMSRAFSSDSVRKMLEEEDSLYHAEELFQKFGNVLQAYASATGDLHDDSIKSLAEDMQKHKDILRKPFDNSKKLEAEQIYFGKYVMPKIIDFHCKKNNISQPLTISDTLKVMAAVENNSKNNRFKTHSFNGSLLPEIKKNGLDISKEMFKEEYGVLASANMMQPYQKGNLLFCELSKASFGYALRAPERLVMSLSRYGHEQQNDQTTNSYLLEAIEKKLSENENLSESDKQKVFAAGKKIVDFYFGEHNKSAIAFVKDAVSYEPVKPEKYAGLLASRFSTYRFSSQLTTFLNQSNDTELSEKYTSAVAEFRQNKNSAPILKIADDFERKYPDSNLFRDETEIFKIKYMSEYGLNNFTYNGNADGYKIAGGKLSRDEFALAEFDNPVSVFVDYHKKQKLLDNKLAVLRNRLAKKIDDTLGIDVFEKMPLPEPLKNVERNVAQAIFNSHKKEM